MIRSVALQNGRCVRVQPYLEFPASRFALPSTCVGFQVQPEAGQRWKLLHKRLMDH